MNIQPLYIPDVRLVIPERFGDERGFFSETYSHPKFVVAGITDVFVQDNHSRSEAAGTIRGFHFQHGSSAHAKLVRVVRGSILDVAVDIRVGSPTFGRHVAETLSAENWHQLYIPVGFAHAFCTLEPDTEVCYKISSVYDPAHEAGLLWNDPALGVQWPKLPGDPFLSEKDCRAPTLKELPEFFHYES